MIFKKDPWVIAESEHWIIGYCMTINTLIGTGVLGISWAYSEMGWGLGVISQLLASAIGSILLVQIVQVMSRMESIHTLQQSGASIRPFSLRDVWAPQPSEHYIITEEEAPSVENSELRPLITAKRFDMIEMARVLYGERWGNIFIVVFSFQLFPSLIGYTAIFASSLTDFVPIFGETCNIYDDNSFDGSCRYIYAFYASIFLAIVTILVIRGLTEQVILQVCACLIRFIVIFIIALTSLLVIAAGTTLNGENTEEVKSFDFAGIGRGLPIIIVATFFQNSIPNTVQFVKEKPKGIPRIIVWSAISSTILFLLLGILVPFAVNDIEKLVSLNWEDYSGGLEDTEWWAYMISGIVVIFPVFDAISIFPIVAINLSDNLLTLKNPNYKLNETNSHEYIFYRLLPTIPAVLIAMFLYDISIILDIVGAFNLIVSGIFIPLFWIAATTIVPQRGEYDWCFADPFWAYLMLGFNIFLFFGILIATIISIAE